MTITCPKCAFSARINNRPLSERGVFVRCPKCQARFRLPVSENSAPPPTKVVCPKCCVEQPVGEVCCHCGVIFRKIPPPSRVAASAAPDVVAVNNSPKAKKLILVNIVALLLILNAVILLRNLVPATIHIFSNPLISSWALLKHFYDLLTNAVYFAAAFGLLLRLRWSRLTVVTLLVFSLIEAVVLLLRQWLGIDTVVPAENLPVEVAAKVKIFLDLMGFLLGLFSLWVLNRRSVRAGFSRVEETVYRRSCTKERRVLLALAAVLVVWIFYSSMPVFSGTKQITRKIVQLNLLRTEEGANSYVDMAERAESVDEKLYYYKKALISNPDDINALIGRGDAYLRKGASGQERDLLGTRSPFFRKKGLADFTRAIELSPDSAEAYIGRGRAYRLLGRIEEALADINHAIEIDSENSRAYFERSHVFQANRDIERQFADLNTALSLEPQSMNALLGMALCYAEKGEYENANVELDKAISIDRDNQSIYVIRAQFNSRQGKTREAIDDYSRAIELNPLSYQLYEQRSYSYRKLGEIELAKADETKRLELMPDAHYLQGAWGEGDQAIVSLNKAIELNPWDYSYYMIRGRVIGRKGDLKNALADLDNAVEIGVDVPDPYIFRSMVYCESGRYEEAIDDLKTACDLGKCEEYQIAVNSIVPYHGQVIDEETREPVADALIVLKRTAKVHEAWSGRSSLQRDLGTQYGISDAQGRFIIPPLSTRPVVPDLMGRETVTYIAGVYHPQYVDSHGSSLKDPANVIVEVRKGTIISDGNFEALFTREGRLALRKEDVPRIIEVLKTWKFAYEGGAIKRKIEELKSNY